VTLINSFTPTIGQTFTVLSAAGGLGGTTFSNTTIAINSSEQFDITYTSTGVVLTVVSTGPSNSNKPAQGSAQMAVAADPKAVSKSTRVSATNNLRHVVGSGIGKRVQVASAGSRITGGAGVSTIAASTIAPRIWEHVPATPSWDHVKAVAVQTRTVAGSTLSGSTLAGSTLAHHVNNWAGSSHAVPVQAPLAGWAGVNNTRRVPMHLLPTTLPVVR
jgi:hypothetical protein